MISGICERLGFDKASIVCIKEAKERIYSQKEAVLNFETAEKLMFGGDGDFMVYLEKSAGASGVNRYTSDMVFWLMCGFRLYDIYREKGYPEELCTDCLRDLKYKNDECLKMYGVSGTFTTWFQKFYTLQRFAFGRLEYDVSEWAHDDYRGFLKKGDLTFSCHIPSCGPLLPEAVMDSFRRLHAFFKDGLKDGIAAVRCSSWLLYPPLIALCREDSNMRRFYDMFDIVLSNDQTGSYSDLWRIFYKMYEGPESLAALPENTSFQRAAKKFFMEGGSQGVGTGVILFDGERIINK